jgi:hypothetical protein
MLLPLLLLLLPLPHLLGVTMLLQRLLVDVPKR